MNKSPGWSIRGVMLDPARLIERHEFYVKLLPRLAEWSLNTLWWHFTDDQGFMLKLKSHPELASPHAFSRAEMRRFLSVAADCGIDVVPEVESLGHTRCITALPRYAELADGDEFGFNAICPSHPRTLPLLKEIIAEVAGLFPSPYFHAGLDEVDLGGCPRCRRRLRGRPAWWVYAQHALAVRDIVAAAGKRMIVWADHVEGAPAMLKALPRDIVLAHWQYTDIRPDAIRRSLAEGFQVIGCPSLCHWGDLVMPNAANFANMDAMTAFLRRAGRTTATTGSRGARPVGQPPRPGVLGLVNTWWTSWRGLRDAYLPAVAYTGAMIAAGGPAGKPAFARRFCREFFGLADSATGDALWQLHRDMLDRRHAHACLFDSPAGLAEAVRLGGDDSFLLRGRRVMQALSVLRRCRRRVKRNRSEFAAILLAGVVAAVCFRQTAAAAEAHEKYRRAEWEHDLGKPPRIVLAWLRQAERMLSGRARDLAVLRRAVLAEWDRTRYKDDPKKGLSGGWSWNCDSLVARVDRAWLFLDALRRGLRAGMADYPRTRRLPGGTV